MTREGRLVRLRERCGGRGPWWALAVVLLTGVVVEAVRDLTAGRHPSDLPIIDDWLSAGLILASSAICARGARRRPAGPARAAWWCFAAALLLYGLAVITESVLYAGGRDIPTPNPTDPLYLSTYPLFMAGLVGMVRARVRDAPWHRWLDGFVLVLVVATPGVLLVIEPVVKNAPIDLLGKTVTVAYPLGDVLLLGALLGTLPLMSWRLIGSWPWVAAGLVCLTFADAAYSLDAADVTAHNARYDFLWTAGALAFAVGATRLPSRVHPSREITGWPAIALPLGASLFAVATQVYGYFRPLPDAERLLTIAVLLIGIAQIIVSRPRPEAEREGRGPRSGGCGRGAAED